VTVAARLAALVQALRDVFYGATGYEFERQAARLRGDLENLFLFMIVGDTIGVPILPPYYSLRVLPYVLPQISIWKRRVLRERHPLEHEEFDLHGV
jgi:hypothetical protein